MQKNRLPEKRVRGVGLVDGDSAGDTAIDKFKTRMDGESNFHSRVERLRPSKDLAVLYTKKGFEPRVDLEGLFPKELWATAKNEGWLERRTNAAVFERFLKTKKEAVLSIGSGELSPDEETLPIFYEVKVGNKADFSKLFIKLLDEKPEVADPFKATLAEVRTVLTKGLI